MDNLNLMYGLSGDSVEIGTARECFFCSQLVSAGHKVEYGGMKTGDFRIDGEIVIEVGGEGKDMTQFGGSDREKGFRALDGIDSAFGCLY